MPLLYLDPCKQFVQAPRFHKIIVRTEPQTAPLEEDPCLDDETSKVGREAAATTAAIRRDVER